MNWKKRVAEKLVGKTIKSVRYMTEKEMNSFMWYNRGIVITLSDGHSIYPMADDEGNDAGAMGTTYKDLGTIPVI